jgi:ssDNA-binding replication factor A large subunit
MNDNITEAVEATISQLKPGMESVNITFKVLSTGEKRTVESQRNDETYHVLDAQVGDSTGTIQMPVWNEAIESISVGETYTLLNGYTGLFRGNLQLKIGNRSSLKSAEKAIDEVNSKVDMSAEDHGNRSRY